MHGVQYHHARTVGTVGRVKRSRPAISALTDSGSSAAFEQPYRVGASLENAENSASGSRQAPLPASPLAGGGAKQLPPLRGGGLGWGLCRSALERLEHATIAIVVLDTENPVT